MWRLALAVLLVDVTLAPAQPAPPSEATRLFEEGRALAAEGNFAPACERFAKSLQLDRATGTEVNLANCQEMLGHKAEAWRLFTDAADQSDREHNDVRAKFARERATALESKLATIVVKIADPGTAELQVTIAGRVVAPATEIHERVDPGPVEIVVTAPGRPKFQRTQQVAVGATAIVDTASPAAQVEQHVTSPNIDNTPEGGGRSRSRVHLAMGLGVGAGAALVASIGLGLVARSSYHSTRDDRSLCDANFVCTPDGQSKIASAQHLADVGTGFALVAGVLAVAGGIVYLTAPHEVMIAPTGTGVAVAGRF